MTKKPYITQYFPTVEREARDERQTSILQWALAAFGGKDTTPRIRLLRFIEEAIELGQAGGLSVSDIQSVVDYVLDRPPGDVAQEIGGVMVTLEAYGEAAGLSITGCEEKEIHRINSKSVEHFQKRQQEKSEAGLL
jgi:hypothetical protein